MSEPFDFEAFKASADTLLNIPGKKQELGTEVWYFQSEISSNKVLQFDRLLAYESTAQAKTGGISLMNCEVTALDLGSYIAIGFRGDLMGWRRRVHEAAEGLDLKLARIVDNDFVIEEQQSVLLSECDIRFLYPERSKKSKPKYREDFLVKRGVVYKI